MGKKKKGSGSKSGKKKKGGKKKKSTEPEMSWQEALLAYKINLKEKAMEELKYELRGLEELNENHKSRNERLVQERALHLDNLVKEARDNKKKETEDSDVGKEAVMEVMKENWEAARQQEIEVADWKEKLAKKELEIISVKRDVKYWHQYRDKGRFEHEKQIKLLQQEISDTISRTEEVSTHFQKALVDAKGKIQSHTDQTLDQQKYLATEKAMAKLDKYSRQEVLDNDWLKKEVDVHQTEADEAMAIVNKLEEENVAIMEELFECTADDLKISKGLFLTQFQEDDNLEESDILQMDLADLSIHQKNKGQDHKILRPKSSTQRFIEQKVHGSMEEDANSSEYESDAGSLESEEEDPFNNYLQIDDEDFEDYLKLGPLELKLLNITGSKMPLYKCQTPTAEERHVMNCHPDDWPVTKSMISTSLKPH